MQHDSATGALLPSFMSLVRESGWFAQVLVQPQNALDRHGRSFSSFFVRLTLRAIALIKYFYEENTQQ